MKQAKFAVILGLVCQALTAGDLLFKLIHDVIVLVGGAINYTCLRTTTIDTRMTAAV